jgi:cbb3-type cytochrome oxidase maturation protein
MSVLVLLIVASLAMALLFLGGFIWAVRSGQYDDTYTPSLRPLMDEPPPTNQAGPTASLSEPDST